MFLDLDLSSPEAHRRAFPAVDAAKLICAIVVVMAHTSPFSDVHSYLAYASNGWLVRFPVPFFFVSGAYFCFRKISLDAFDHKRALASAWRMLRLYLLWVAVFAAPILFDAWKHAEGFDAGMLSFFQSAMLAGYSHLWYLKSAALATALVALALRCRMKPEAVFGISLVLFLVGMFGDTYYGVVKGIPVVGTAVSGYLSVFLTTRNGLFYGLVYVAMGALFAYRRVTIKMPLAIGGFFAAALLSLAEAFVVRRLQLAWDYSLYLFMLPAVFFLFYIVTHIDMKRTPVTDTMRAYSSLIYYTHAYFNFLNAAVLIPILAWITGEADFQLHSLLRFVLVLMGAVLSSALILKLETYRPFRWLKRLH